MTSEIDTAQMTIGQQLDYLFEGTYFADEGSSHLEQQLEGLVASFSPLHNKVNFGNASEEEKEQYTSLSKEMEVVRRKLGEQKKSLSLSTTSGTSLRAQMRSELQKKLEKSAASGVPLRIYLGVDPTRTSLHIGHMVAAVNLRRFQRLGHTVIFLIGDYTATIGDPSGQTSERETFTHERVLELAKFYTGQAFRLLDESKTEVRYNGEWLADLRFGEIAELAAQFPLGQVIARQDFRDRMESGAGVRLHESLYMLMQGYDAFALNCDVQVGGYDQHMNLLAGRTLQKYFAKKLKGTDHPLFAEHCATGKAIRGPHVMLTYPLLMGTDGRKMSKSWGNTIDVMAEPHDMYGKVMRISDEMIANYIDVAVEATPAVKAEQKAQAVDDPMGVKKWIAHSITALYHGDEVAGQAAEYFKRTVQEKSFAEEDIPELKIPDPYKLFHDVSKGQIDSKEVYVPEDYRAEVTEVRPGVTPQPIEVVLIKDLLVELGIVSSKKEAFRLMKQGAVRITSVWPTAETLILTNPQNDYYSHAEYHGGILQVGKRKVFKLV